MFDLLKCLLPLGLFGMMNVDGDGGGDGGDKGKEAGDKSGGDGDKVSKEDFDTLQANFDKGQKDLEDMRMEVLTPDYLDYLNDKGKKGDEGDDKGKKEDKPTELSDDVIEKMSKKELLAEATKRASEKHKADLEDIKKNYASDKDASTKKDIAAFARAHEDFETYRPVMYGLSLDPKNSDKTLLELYTASKEHVQGIHTKASEAEKEKSKKSQGEKPGGASDSFEADKKLSKEDAAKSALEETKAELGPMPSA